MLQLNWIKREWHALWRKKVKKEPYVFESSTEDSEIPEPVKLPPTPPLRLKTPPTPPRPKSPPVIVLLPEPVVFELKLVKGVWARLATTVIAQNKAKDEHGDNFKAHMPVLPKIIQLKSEMVVMFERPEVIIDEVVMAEPAPLQVIEEEKKLVLFKGIWTRLATRVNQELDFMEQRHTNIHAIPPDFEKVIQYVRDKPAKKKKAKNKW